MPLARQGHASCWATDSGGKLSAELLRDVFLPAFRNPVLARLDDQAVVEISGVRLAFTTDTFVVKPLFFPGGDIGSLAVHGTVNDLAMGGAQPLFLSAAFILEEGFPMATLRRIGESMARAAEAAGVEIVTGDTKVVEKGSGDGVFINTSGIGLVPPGLTSLGGQRAARRPRAAERARSAITASRSCPSAKAWSSTRPWRAIPPPLHTLVRRHARRGRRRSAAMRDPTRGGLASTLNEIAAQSRVGIELDEDAIPIREEVRGACELLGLDPLVRGQRRQAGRHRRARSPPPPCLPPCGGIRWARRPRSSAR